MSIYTRTKEELLSGVTSAPGRVRTFLLSPEQGTTPHSCTRYEWRGDLVDLLMFATRALKGGSGVKVTFPTNTELAVPKKLGAWKITIDIIESSKHGHCFRVDDSIEGEWGILDSWTQLINLSSWDGVLIYLGGLRSAGCTNSNGLVASGWESFATIYQAIATYLESGTIGALLKLLGTLNSVMRRGGYKKGIITSSMSSECPLIKEYLGVPVVDLDGSHKKGVIVYDLALEDPELIDLIVESRNAESTFIEKPCDEGLAFNVCMGLVLGHKATCLIWRVNLGMCTVDGIVRAFKQVALDICELHTTWRDRCPELARYYAPLKDDRQVGLDVMGLANLLAINGVTYRDFADAIESLLNNTAPMINTAALDIAYRIIQGYSAAKLECDKYMLNRNLPPLDRIFTVEPAMNHAYDTTDLLGKTTCRGIFAPTGRIEKRVSSTQQNKRYHHGNVETDVMVGIELHERLCDLWQVMMDRTGRAHGISQDTWSEMTLESLIEFGDRPSRSLYYSEAGNYNQRGYLAKSVQVVTVCDISRLGECLACAD
jgi:hypothetical protein